MPRTKARAPKRRASAAEEVSEDVSGEAGRVINWADDAEEEYGDADVTEEQQDGGSASEAC